MRAFTDYPKPGEAYSGKLREVKIVKFDGNKYVLLSTGETMKAGYVYRSRRKVSFRWKTLERNLPVGWLDEN